MTCKPLSEWPLHEIEAEMDRLEERMAGLPLWQAVVLVDLEMAKLEAELERRCGAAKSEQTS
jgi:hypothetical protein